MKRIVSITYDFEVEAHNLANIKEAIEYLSQEPLHGVRGGDFIAKVIRSSGRGRIKPKKQPQGE